MDRDAPAPPPSLRAMRSVFAQHCYRKTPLFAIALVAALFVSYCGLFAASVVVEPLAARIVLGALCGAVTGILFVEGHDASHGSTSDSVRLNRLLARIAFLPALQPNELWDLEHNRRHHSWTNLRGKDPGYPPLTLEEYRALPAPRRLLHRLGFVPALIGLQYWRIWWNANLRVAPQRRAEVRSMKAYRLELLALASFLALQLGAVWHFGAWTRRDPALFLLEAAVCILWPLHVWNTIMAFVTIQHHTHPSVRWYGDEREWSTFDGHLRGTVEIVWPKWFAGVFLHIFSHTAHHVDKRIPLRNLPQAQRCLRSRYPAEIVVERGSLGRLLDTLARCRLYDYEAHRWRDWDGTYTT